MLMAADRLGTQDVPLTHEFLALMLGVRRSGITVAIQVLEGLEAVKNTRSQVTILDRERLEIVAGPSYGALSIVSARASEL